MNRTVRSPWPATILLVLGIMMLGRWVMAEAGARGYQSLESGLLDAARSGSEQGSAAERAGNLVTSGAGESVAPLPILEPGVTLGRLEVPRLGLKAIVAEGVGKSTLDRAVGHVPLSALPGSPGNCALAGHRDTFLRGLGAVRADDVIRIVTRHRTHLYQVEWSAVVDPHQVEVMDSTAARSLTLITCFPFRYIGPAPQRFVVRAREVEPLAGP